MRALPDGGGVDAFSPAAIDVRSAAGDPCSARSLREVLPDAVARQLDESVDAPGRFLLLIEGDDERFQHTHWESAHWRGAAARERFVVVRRPRPVFGRCTPGMKKKQPRPALINLFPPAEFDFARALAPRIESGELWVASRKAVATGVEHVGELFVLAHGDERGLLGPDGRPCGEVLRTALPEVVWLLACDAGGAMPALAEELLGRGVRTVVASTGEISAAVMADLVERRMDGLRSVVDPASFLASTWPSGQEAPALTVFGQCLIDDSPAGWLNEKTYDAWRGGTVGPYLPDGVPTVFCEALACLDDAASGLWPTSADWLEPQLLSLAETHDFGAMQRLDGRAMKRRRTPAVAHALAESRYRQGRYEEMAGLVANGLAQAPEHSLERKRLLEMLVCLLIDMDVPVAAEAAVAEHDACHATVHPESTSPEVKRLDWLCRIALKKGELAIASDHANARAQQSVGADRALPWQLYIESWRVWHGDAARRARADALAREAMARLGPVPTGPVGRGKEGDAYLLRALACHRWACHDAAVGEFFERWGAHVEDGVAMIDPGPYAFGMIYLALAGDGPTTWVDRGLAQLERARYFLEAHAFAMLAGKVDVAERCGRLFRELRETSLGRLDPAILKPLPILDAALSDIPA